MRSKYEKKAEQELKQEGYKTDYKARPGFNIRGYNVDYFNLFDLMAYKDGELRLIQIKGHEGVSGNLREAIKEFIVSKIEKEIWTFRSNGTVKKEKL